jgi:tetratricopeptide (TPR) repeat protein
MWYDLYRRREYRKAIEVIRQHPIRGLLETQFKYVAAYGQLGDIDKAREHWNKCLELDSNWSVAMAIDMHKLWNSDEAVTPQVLEGFAKAGFVLSR